MYIRFGGFPAVLVLVAGFVLVVYGLVSMVSDICGSVFQ